MHTPLVLTLRLYVLTLTTATAICYQDQRATPTDQLHFVYIGTHEEVDLLSILLSLLVSQISRPFLEESILFLVSSILQCDLIKLFVSQKRPHLLQCASLTIHSHTLTFQSPTVEGAKRVPSPYRHSLEFKTRRSSLQFLKEWNLTYLDLLALFIFSQIATFPPQEDQPPVNVYFDDLHFQGKTSLSRLVLQYGTEPTFLLVFR